jgi:hypothetical protein
MFDGHELDLTDRHIAEGCERVRRQRQRVADESLAGFHHPQTVALLKQLKISLPLMVAHREMIISRLRTRFSTRTSAVSQRHHL